MFCVRKNNTPYKIGKFDIISKDTADARSLEFTKEYQKNIDSKSVSTQNSVTGNIPGLVYLKLKRASDTDFSDWKMNSGIGSQMRVKGIIASVRFTLIIQKF